MALTIMIVHLINAKRCAALVITVTDNFLYLIIYIFSLSIILFSIKKGLL